MTVMTPNAPTPSKPAVRPRPQVMRLTDAGLHGNSHIPFADMNNDQVARLLFAWLKKNGF